MCYDWETNCIMETANILQFWHRCDKDYFVWLHLKSGSMQFSSSCNGQWSRSHKCQSVEQSRGGLSTKLHLRFLFLPMRKYLSLLTLIEHLIKLIRNNFLAYGFLMDENTNVNGESVQQVITRGEQDLKTTFKLSQKHISVSGSQKISGKLAAQLPNTTA